MSLLDLKIFCGFFLNRTDTYTIQNENNAYTRIEYELKEEDIVQHLNGEKTIGVYQFNKDKVKWICFDFDGNPEEEFEKAKRLYSKIKDGGVETVLLEFSGKKGYHVWVFCESIDGASAKYWAQEISSDSGVHEIFPKQDKVGEKFGNCVKLPLCIHQSSKKRSYFFNEDFVPLESKQNIDFLVSFNSKKLFIVPKIIVKEIVRTIIKPPTKQNIPSYVEYLIQNGAKEGERHKNTFILVKELYNSGYSNQAILEQVRIFNNNSSPPQPVHVVENHTNYLLAFPEKYLIKEIVENPVQQNELREFSKASYSSVIKTYSKWLLSKDTFSIDLALAIAVSRKESKVPLWVIFIAPSGSGKSEIIRPFEDHNSPSTTEIISKITPNTFLSGKRNDKGEIDFGETLEGIPKLFLTFDFSQFVKLDPKEKGQLWAQLRDLYDGFLERKAFQVSKKIVDIRVNWIICSTPVVDNELLIHQELGTRELIYRFDYEDNQKKDLMKRVWGNSQKLEELRKELKVVVRNFIRKRESEWRQIEISDQARDELMDLAMLVSTLRAAAESDPFTGELTNFVYEEMPTRILLQLRSLFEALMNLDEEYEEKKALEIIQKVVLSSIHPIRLRILMELMKDNPISTTNLQKKVSIGWKNVTTQLFTAKQLGLVEFEEVENEEEGQVRNWKKKMWRPTDHQVIKYLMKINNLDEKWKNLYEKVYS